MLLTPGGGFTYNGEEHSFPDIRLVYWAGGNPFHHHQDLRRLRKAWRKPATIVVHEQYWTATARHADIVLPATTTGERNDIGYASGEGCLVAMKRVQPPHAKARNEFDIFANIAARLGVIESFTEGKDEEAWLRYIYEECRDRNRASGIDLPDFDAFWRRGLIDLGEYDRPRVILSDFRKDPAANPLPTPSGRIEIHSERIAAMRLPDCPGHPAWLEPHEWLGAKAADWYPLHLLSDQPARRLHSQLDASPHSLEGKVAGREPVYLNGADAEARGIRTGDLVELFNDRGRLVAGAVVTEALMEGVVRISTGAWLEIDPQTGVERHGNPNVLTPDIGASSLSMGCAAQSCLVDARKWGGEAPAMVAHKAPDIRSELGETRP